MHHPHVQQGTMSVRDMVHEQAWCVSVALTAMLRHTFAALYAHRSDLTMPWQLAKARLHCCDAQSQAKRYGVEF